jgi:GrpE
MQNGSKPEPLEIPRRALEIDMAQSFSQLLFRATKLQKRREEEALAAKATERELLETLIEVDDTLGALSVNPDLIRMERGLGINAARRRLLGKLAKSGVKPMRLEGLIIDPDLAEIVATEPNHDPGVHSDTVVQIVVSGFFWGEEVLRRAQVVVAAEYTPRPEHAPQVEEAPQAGGAPPRAEQPTDEQTPPTAAPTTIPASATSEPDAGNHKASGKASGKVPKNSQQTRRNGNGARGRKPNPNTKRS